MIHPSTMAGPNWFTGSFGTTNPFQQSASPFFRNTPMGGQQGGFGPGNNPFQSQPFGFGTHTTQMQNTINEIVRQVVPTVLANCGIQPNSIQNPIGFQTFGQQTPFGFQIPTGPSPLGPQSTNATWTGFIPTELQLQNPQIIAEVVRQATSQTVQNLAQQMQNPYSQTPVGQNPGFQPFSAAGPSPFGVMQNPFVSSWPQIQQPQQLQQLQQLQQQNFWNLISQVCQAAATTAIACLQQQQSQSQNAPFNVSNPSAFGVSPGIPAGVGAF